ncbi:MFS general substrate transporter [Mollisia scopiformis]|uniref:MFS general substrate transporter n=1 Tax=Mollisia scopiformis TaxID=149040 RepID=A0A194XD66_MOLSC|nr:MFS general substrate transporter [Mollisia scopiformis]KUJ17697.1 MFS general substrate transporter [Mollisia scopiformis]
MRKSKLEKRLLLKMDVSIVPLLGLSFFIAYMDRNNLGNARIMGMQTDLALSDEQFFNCLMVFFVGYMVFMLPANLGMRVIGPPRQLGAAVIFFGVCGTCLSAVKSYGAVIGLRILIGMGEAFVQVGLLYFSFWYKRDEVATRAAVYYTSATISGCFSGLIAYGVQRNLDGVHGRHAWQWLYIVEGIPAIGLGIIILLFLPSFPDIIAKKGSHYFSNDEIDLALQRMAEGKFCGYKLKYSEIWLAFKDPKSYFTAVIYGALCLGIASVTSFLPTFIQAFGFDKRNTVVQTQLFTMIPYAFATVSLLTVCFLSDRINSKGPILFICMATSSVGYIILMATTNKVALIAGTCFVASGLYPAVILTVSWITINHGGYTKRSTAWAMAQITGQGLSIIGTQVYRTPPRYLAGHGTLLGFFCLALVSIVCNWFWMRRENHRKDARAEEFRAAGTKDEEAEKSMDELLDKHPSFKYIL